MENDLTDVVEDNKRGNKQAAVARNLEDPEPKSNAAIQPDKVHRDEYPTGIKLFLIITALCLAIFLASLDMVRILWQSGSLSYDI